MRLSPSPNPSPSRAPGLKIERDPPFPKIFSSAFETVPMEAGKTGRGVDLQACVPRAFQKPILRGEVAVLSGFMGQDCEGPSVVANLGI